MDKYIERLRKLTIICCQLSIHLFLLNDFYVKFLRKNFIDISHINALFNELKLQTWNNFCINMREYVNIIIKLFPPKTELNNLRDNINDLQFLSFFLKEKYISKPLSFSLHNYSEFEYKREDVVISEKMIKQINLLFKKVNKDIIYKEFKKVYDLIYKIKKNKTCYWQFYINEKPYILIFIEMLIGKK